MSYTHYDDHSALYVAHSATKVATEALSELSRCCACNRVNENCFERVQAACWRQELPQCPGWIPICIRNEKYQASQCWLPRCLMPEGALKSIRKISGNVP